jgi:hypothetical protein
MPVIETHYPDPVDDLMPVSLVPLGPHIPIEVIRKSYHAVGTPVLFKDARPEKGRLTNVDRYSVLTRV